MKRSLKQVFNAPWHRTLFAALLFLSAPSLTACGGDDANEDGDAYVPPDRPDGDVNPGYNECLSGDGGVSGGGDAGACGDAGAVDAGPPPPPCNEYTFSYVDAAATSVWVTGDWTGWAATVEGGAVELTNDGSGMWSVTTLINRGQNAYKFIVDGANWIADPNAEQYVDDGFGGQNSAVTVCGDQTYPVEACGNVAEFDWRSTVMYFAMVDRFRDSDGMKMGVTGASGPEGGSSKYTGSSGNYEGGDLAGVTERMDYLANLGVTALWLSAPYENREEAGASIEPAKDSHMYSAYHGYWPSPEFVDWSQPNAAGAVESRIGTATDLHNLVSAAHSATTADGHGMKVLFDYVMNHVDANSGLYQSKPEWFAKDNGNFRLCGPENLWDDPIWGTKCAFTDYLPPFDYGNAEARAWSVNDALWWAKEFNIDGYRLDAIKHVPLNWLTDLRTRLNADITGAPDDRFYLVGETFDYTNRDLLKSFVDPDTMLDGQFDFPFKYQLCEAVFAKSQGLDGFAGWMDGNDGYYGERAIMTTWIGNHDIPRAIHYASGQISNCREGSVPGAGGNAWKDSQFTQPADPAPYERLGVAFAIMFTSPGIPLIYYGDEVGLAGGGDPDNRRMMPWEDDPGAPALNAHQTALRAKVAALGKIRGENPVLGRGVRSTVESTSDTWVYKMSGCDGAADVFVAINRADSAQTVNIPAGSYVDLLNSNAPVSGGALQLGARGFAVWRVAP